MRAKKLPDGLRTVQAGAFQRYVREHDTGRKPYPLVAVTCECGAVWLGKYAIRNEVITEHRRRVKRCAVQFWIPIDSAALSGRRRTEGTT